MTGKLLRESKMERVTHSLMVGDSLHLGNMNRHKIPIKDIVTNDGDFDYIPNITVWKPEDVIQ